jgi:hypothetical protein
MPLEKLDRPATPHASVSTLTRANGGSAAAPQAERESGERGKPDDPPQSAAACCALLRPAPSPALPQPPAPGAHRPRATGRRAGAR